MPNTPDQPALPETYSALVVDGDPARAEWQERPFPQRASDHEIVRIEYSALNYKDALAASGHPGVAKSLPLVPGIDAVGTIIASQNADRVGRRCLIAHADFGTAHDGGFAQYATVPNTWTIDLPASLNSREAVLWGTAGFTAAQSVEQIQFHQVTPADGPVVVTGASGGVGSFAVAILAKLGYEVVASTGKLDQEDWLKQLGASRVIDRKLLNDDSPRPLLKGEYAAAVDTVGGNTLHTLLRSVKLTGCVTACGLVGGAELHTNVYPFILRGVTLCGIDSANISQSQRQQLWNRIASQYALDGVDKIAQVVQPDQLGQWIEQILQGQVSGRVIINMSGPTAGPQTE